MFQNFLPDFLFLRFIIITLVSVLLCLWIFYIHDFKTRYYYFSFSFFIYFYCGIGWSYDCVETQYIYYYAIFFFFFNLTSFLLNREKKEKQIPAYGELLRYTLEKYAIWIIVIYLFLCILEMIFPENKLMYLFLPPRPDIGTFMEHRYYHEINHNTVSFIVYYLKNLLHPFYLLVICKFSKNFKIFFLLVLFPLYMQYCHDGYLGRSIIMVDIISVFVLIYYQYPSYRRKILIFSITVFPLCILLLFLYSEWRVSADTSFSYNQLFSIYQTIFFQEVSYPLHFFVISRQRETMIFSYLEWIITLPLPGFLKNSMNYEFNYYIAELILNKDITEYGFYVTLSGLVNESLFIFGKILFVLHAVIAGLITSIPIRFMRAECEIFLLVYSAIYCSYCMARGGTPSVYPFLIKTILLYLVVREIYCHCYRGNFNSY